MECESVRRLLDENELEPAVEAHVAECSACTAERRVTLAVRSAFMLEAPPDLSARLLALAQPAPQASRLDLALREAVVMPAPADLTRRLELLVPGAAVQPVRRPWLMPLYMATVVVMGVVLFFAAQVYGAVLQQLGVGDLWQSLAQLPSEWLEQFYVVFPQGHYIVQAFFALQSALQWVLLGLLMWAVLEMRTPRRAQVTA